MSLTFRRRFIPCIGLVGLLSVWPNRDALADPPISKWEQRDIRQIGLSLHFEAKKGVPRNCDAEETLRSSIKLFHHYDIFFEVPPEVAQMPLPYTTIHVVVERRAGMLWSSIRYIDERSNDLIRSALQPGILTKCPNLMHQVAVDIGTTNRFYAPPLPESSEEEEEEKKEEKAPAPACKNEKPAPALPPPPIAPIAPIAPPELPPPPPEAKVLPVRSEIGVFMGAAFDPDLHSAGAVQGLLFRRQSLGLDLGFRAPWSTDPDVKKMAATATLLTCQTLGKVLEGCLFLRASWDHAGPRAEAPGVRIAYAFQSDWPIRRLNTSYRLFADMQTPWQGQAAPMVLGASISTDFTFARSSR